jgi:hypothetical protein
LLNETQSLEKIAELTGGLTAAGAANIAELLPKIEDDATDYYSLAFRGGGGTDRARGVVVKVRNPDYVVRARRQFVEKSETTRVKDRVAAALMIDQPGDFDIHADPAPVETRGGQRVMPVKIRIPISALTLLSGQGKHTGSYSVFAAASDDRGTFSEVGQATQPFEIPDDRLEDAVSGTFIYNLNVVVDSRTRRVAIGVLDEVSKELAVIRVPVPR